jgi:hypothetical protein
VGTLFARNAVTLDPRIARRISRALGALALLVGVALAGAGGYWLERLVVFKASAIATEGTVLRNDQVDWSSQSASGMGTSFHTSYRAIVRFTDRAGRGMVYADFFAFNPPSFQVGDRVRVLYDSRRPERALVDRGSTVLYVLLGICAFGAFIALSGVRRLLAERNQPWPSDSAVDRSRATLMKAP